MKIPGKHHGTDNPLEVAYALYKIDWKEQHNITLKTEKLMAENYHQYCRSRPSATESFEEFVEMIGYPGGEIYASLDEFTTNELQDFTYLQYLLPNALLDGIKTFKESFEYTDEDIEKDFPF